MTDYRRSLGGLGASFDDELARAMTEIATLRETVAQLRLDLERDKDLLETLKRSQETRGRQLKKARAREAALLQQLVEAGLVEVEPTSGPDEIVYLNQRRQRQT